LGVEVLGQRYEYDGKPILGLNRLQLQMKEQIDLKVRRGDYEFGSVPCCICDSTDFEVLSMKDRYGLYMPTVICKSCGLIQTNPRMNQQSYNGFYNCEYRKLYGGESAPSTEFFSTQYQEGKRIYSYLQDFQRLSSSKPDLFVVEIGCGAGGILHYFRERGCRVYGIDLGQEYVDFGINEYGLDLAVGTVAGMSLDASPDVVIYSHVLEHVLSPREELSHVSRVLACDGVVYFEMPGVKNLLNSYEMDFLRFLQNAHTYHFTLTTLTNLLNDCGFQLIAGDESIRGICSKNTDLRFDVEFRSDYQAVMSYLRKVEFFRKVLPFPLYKVKRAPRLAIIEILRLLGVYEFARRGYRELGSRIAKQRSH
jgi:SAM-dependent methyltransferase